MPVAGPLTIPPLSARVERQWPVPGSKSITNRAYVLGALSDHTVLHNVLESDDTRHMRACLLELGTEIRDIRPGVVEIRGGRHRLRAPERPLFVGNSGTTVRFLSGLAVLTPGAVTFTGDEHMSKRPIADLVEGLRQLGLRVDCPSGCPPLTIHGTGGVVTNTRVAMRGEKSSQYLTALLLSAGMFDHDLEVAVEGDLVSRPYIDMTVNLVGKFGGLISEVGNVFHVKGGRSYGIRNAVPPVYRIEPDASSASYPFALAAVTGSAISVPGLGEHSLQGDWAFVRVLQKMGATLKISDDATGMAQVTQIVGPPSGLSGVDEDMHHISDTVMTLAAIAPLCEGPTTIRNVANIRIKETDRLAATVAELRRLGQQVEHGDDWLRIAPRPLKPASIECYHDHRMAMSFAVLAAAARDHHWDQSVPAAERRIVITDPACTAKTYPGFWDDLAGLYPVRPW